MLACLCVSLSDRVSVCPSVWQAEADNSESESELPLALRRQMRVETAAEARLAEMGIIWGLRNWAPGPVSRLGFGGEAARGGGEGPGS